MKRAISLFFVLTAVSLVAGKTEEEKPALEPAGRQTVAPVEGPESRLAAEMARENAAIRPEERAALVKLRRLQGCYCVISRTGHVTQIGILGQQVKDPPEVDLRFISALSHLEKLDVAHTRVSVRGMDSLL